MLQTHGQVKLLPKKDKDVSKTLAETIGSNVQIMFWTYTQISVLGYRDSVFDEHRRIYHIDYKYEFAMSENGQITPRDPMLQGYLYESALESQLFLCYDRESKLMGIADKWPGQASTKIGKGRRLRLKTLAETIGSNVQIMF